MIHPRSGGIYVSTRMGGSVPTKGVIDINGYEVRITNEIKKQGPTWETDKISPEVAYRVDVIQYSVTGLLIMQVFLNITCRSTMECFVCME